MGAVILQRRLERTVAMNRPLTAAAVQVSTYIIRYSRRCCCSCCTPLEGLWCAKFIRTAISYDANKHANTHSTYTHKLQFIVWYGVLT